MMRLPEFEDCRDLELDHRHPLHQAGVVDQDVHRADLGLDLRHHRVDGVLVGDVCGIAVSVNAGSLIRG